MAVPIRPDDLPPAGTIPTNAAIIIDDGASVQKATPAQLVDAARPNASQAEAEAGQDNTKSMTPLRVRQAADSLIQEPGTAAKIGTSDGSTVQDVLSANTDKLLDTVSIMDYIPPEEHAGIRAGTSTYDCSPAAQAAVDAAMTVFFPNGTYWFGSTVREKTNGGARNLIGQNRRATKLMALPALAVTNEPIMWFGNSNGHGNYRLRFQHFYIDGGDQAGRGAAGAIGLRAHECGTSIIGDLSVFGCYTAIDAIGCIGYTCGGERTEIYSSQHGVWHTAPTGGAPAGSTNGDSTTTTESPLTLKDNINYIGKIWMSGVNRPVRIEGGLTQVDHIILQSCGGGADDDLIHLLNANESYDYGGGPYVTDIWCEGGSYRSIIRVENTRDARIRKIFISGSGANCEQGIIVRNSKGCRIDDVAARGSWSRAPSEGRSGNYWMHVDADSQNGVFGPFYFTQNTTTYFIDRTSATHNHVIIDNHRTNNSSNGIIVGPVQIGALVSGAYYLRRDPDMTATPNIYMSGLQVAGVFRAAAIGGSGIFNADTELRVANVKVVGARGAAIANAASGTELATINSILSALRAHGLIAP